VNSTFSVLGSNEIISFFWVILERNKFKKSEA